MVFPAVVSTIHSQLDCRSYVYGKLGVSMTPLNAVSLVLQTDHTAIYAEKGKT